MRCADVLMSFPSLLMAVIALYVFQPGIYSVVLVLSITRLPVYIRTVRAEVLEIRERMFVLAAHTMGAGFFRIVLRHILPVVLPTIIRSEEHTSELQSLMRISYAVYCLHKKKQENTSH